MSASGQIVLQEGRKRDAQKKYEWRCRYFARGVDRIAALIPGIFPRLLEGQTTLANQEVRDIGQMGEQIPDQKLKHYLELRLASTSKDWRRMNTKPRDAKDDALNALVDHALRVLGQACVEVSSC